jgi:protein-S-isoprenylcysteine O-methyltransferase Ste14
MKAKTTSIVVFIIGAYIIPLLGHPKLIITSQIAILILFVVILFATQPPLRFSEAKSYKSSDRNSVIFIILGYFLGQLATIIEWAYYTGHHSWIWDWITITGLMLMLGGTICRIWCIRALGKFFTATVRTQEKQRIITIGTYKVIRHPSYLGAFMAALGSSVFLHAFFATIITTLVLFTAYYFRIKVEEEALINEFGDEYRNYRLRTKKFIPYVY